MWLSALVNSHLNSVGLPAGNDDALTRIHAELSGEPLDALGWTWRAGHVQHHHEELLLASSQHAFAHKTPGLVPELHSIPLLQWHGF